jgi:hypothetical protein
MPSVCIETKNETNRGLLCRHCNSLLGYARDDIDVLKAAISYLNGDGDAH